MKPVLIVENSQTSLIKEASSSKDNYTLSGTFTEFGIKNRNDRIYTSDKFLPALNEMNERMKNLGAVYGEFDHPDVFDTSLSRASHLVTKAEFKKESNNVYGEIKLLSTYWGKEARSLVDDKCPIFVSSRAAGVTENNGNVSIKKLFTYDIVADPGFTSARMDIKVLNESLNYKLDINVRIYEMSDESKINELCNMNKNEAVTKKQLTNYSSYLVKEINDVQKKLNNVIKKGTLEPKKLDQLLEYYENLNNTNDQIVKYLDYMAEKMQIVVNENKSLKDTTTKLIKHNDYLAENLEKSINYSEYLSEKLSKNISYSQYLAENLDKNISYSQYVAEQVDKNISYSQYLAENLDKNISYSEYVAEQVDKNIDYSEYLAEQLDKNISYSEYIAEHLDKNINYSEYIAEHVDNSIVYAEYLAENLDGNIAYSEYIAEHLDDNIAYSEYIAENVDKSIKYQGMIAEKLNSKKLNEAYGDYEPFPTPEEAGFIEDEEQCDLCDGDETQEEDEYIEDEELGIPSDENRRLAAYKNHKGVEDEEYYDDEYCDDEENPEGMEESELSESINNLIKEAKMRKASETNELNFLRFLNKSQVDSFYNLSKTDQETVKSHINESEYFSGKDVLRLISESLSLKTESIEEKVLRYMPDNIKAMWVQMNESEKKAILSQARLYPEEVLTNESQIEHFWLTRNIRKNESITKQLISNEGLIQEDKLQDKEVEGILERFKNL